MFCKDAMRDMYGLTEEAIMGEDISFIGKFVKDNCPTLVGSFMETPHLPILLAPPVSECFDCNSQLVSHHSCNVW